MATSASVVHAVARHGHAAALSLKLFDDLALFLRQDFGLDFRDAELLPNRFGGRAVVSRDHDDAQAVFAQERERFRGCGLDRVADGHQARGSPLHR